MVHSASQNTHREAEPAVLSLMERLEAAPRGDRRLDRDIWNTLEFRHDGEPSHAPAYSTSIDAALGLADRLGLNVSTIVQEAVAREPLNRNADFARYACVAILKARAA